MNLTRAFILIASGAFLASTAVADTTVTVNFDQDQFGVNTFAGETVNAAYPSLGVTYNTSASIYMGQGGVHSQPNFASGSGTDFNSVLTVFFDTTGSAIGAWNVTNSDFTLTAFDAANNVLGSISTNDSGPNEFVGLNVAGIKYATFSPYGGNGFDQYGIDDLTYSYTPSGTPEPVTMSLAAAGLALAARRRRKA